MSDRAADLDGGTHIHGGSAANLQFDCPLVWIILDEDLVLLGAYLGITHIFTLLHVAIFLIIRFSDIISLTHCLWLIYQLSQRQQLLTPNLSIPLSSIAALRALK